MSAEEYYDAMRFEQSVSEKQISIYSEKWKMLQLDNSPLRIMVGGSLVGVAESFPDKYIQEALNNFSGPFRISELIEYVFGVYELMLSEFYLLSRIKRMIDSGVIVLESEWDEDIMKTMVKKA